MFPLLFYSSYTLHTSSQLRRHGRLLRQLAEVYHHFVALQLRQFSHYYKPLVQHGVDVTNFRL